MLACKLLLATLLPNASVMIRPFFIVLLAFTSARGLQAQWFDHTKVPFSLEHDLEKELSTARSLHYVDAGPVLEDKSYLVKFESNDRRTLLIWFPNPDSWTSQAKRKSIQPVIAILQSKDEQRQSELKPDSKLNQLIGKLIEASVANAEQENRESIRYTLKCVFKRHPHAYFDSGFAD